MIGIIITLIFTTILYIANAITSSNSLRLLTGMLVIFFSSLLGNLVYEYLTIPPIEVYRGNTELEITYKNNIPIDTVVVWKNK